jgi:hypothetical protein
MQIGSPDYVRQILEGGDRRAALEMERGRATQELVGGLGQVAAGLVTARAEQKRAAELTKQDLAFVGDLEKAAAEGRPLSHLDFVRRFGPKRGIDLYEGYSKTLDDTKPPDPATLAKFGRALTPGLREATRADRAAQWSRALGQQIPAEALTDEAENALIEQFAPAKEGPKPEKVTTRNADGSETTRFVIPKEGVEFTSAAEVKEPKRHMVTVPGPNGQPIQRLATEEELAAGVQAYRAPTQPSEGARIWVQRDGKTIRIRESEYQPGDTPASVREGGRPVSSPDANRLADFDTSLNDLGELERTLSSSKATGTSAAAGAMLPNAITELTGIGSDAKQKQAVIDRVKQVIGKTLEGGVLRAEDERKYAAILPTIGDPPAVAKAKLDGLRAAIEQRRQVTIEALADANYDVSKYQARDAARAGAKAPGTPKADPLGLR